MIITTHYIEESNGADSVAFMRSGSILRQSAPQILLNEYQCQTLEEVYLKLFERRSKISNKVNIIEEFDSKSNITNKSFNLIDFQNMKTLLWHSYKRSMRLPQLWVIYFLLKVIILTSVRLSMTEPPNNLKVGIYNGEINPELSLKFIEFVDKDIIYLNEYQSPEEAMESVINGTNSISFQFTPNFTDSFISRAENTFATDQKDLDDSKINLVVDNSNIAVTLFIFHSIYHTFVKLANDVANITGTNLHILMTPIDFHDTIYGDFSINFSNFVLPAIMIIYVYMAAATRTGIVILLDQNNSSFERLDN